ncbi:hypothetical protein [Piscibacillus halophilus]|uniref:hypothetical protein n=1 Tax=Piscibacillus halophilus TaxID=571933 RepID=UPI000B838472|nr:hypothetical protein [Piscibacillus halophilus]
MGNGQLSSGIRQYLVVSTPNALITCNEENMGSRKVILNNGGVQDQSFIEEDGTVVNRFWIDMK